MNPQRPGPEASLEEIESVYRARVAEFRRVAAAISGDRVLASDAARKRSR